MTQLNQTKKKRWRCFFVPNVVYRKKYLFTTKNESKKYFETTKKIIIFANSIL